MKSRILVTGGAGFIGSNLVDYLASEGHEVTLFDDLSGGLKENINHKAKFVEGSILEKKITDSIVRDNDVVFHLAAYAAEGLSPFIMNFNCRNNIEGSINVINSCIKDKVKRLVFTSSIAVYGHGNPPFKEEDIPNPDDPYGIAKYTVEMLLKDAHKRFGLDYVILRPHNVYGPKQFLGDPYRNVVGIFMNRIMQGREPVIYGDGKQTRAFSYIGDVVPCIARAGFLEEAKNQIINIGASRTYSVNQLVEEVKEAMDSNLNVIHVEPRNEVKHAHCDNKKAEKILSFEDRTMLKEGIKKMAEWAKKVGPMEPIVWDDYELRDGLPQFWKDIQKEYPDAKKRIKLD